MLEVRRHSFTKKGPGRGEGSHLSQEGVLLARRVGIGLGPFDRVVASPIPRTSETAIAMGFAVDEIIDALYPLEPHLFQEIGHHDRWGWAEPFPEFARLVGLGEPTANLALSAFETWRRIIESLPEHGRGLAISHGRVIECGAVACDPAAEHAGWGPPFRHCERVRITEIESGEFRIHLLRVNHLDAVSS